MDETALASGDPMRKTQLRLFTTRASYAIRAGRYALKVAKYINRSVTFKAGIDAIACQAGDIISLAHDVPQWGFSGRVRASSTDTLIKLDSAVTVEDGRSYRVRIRFADDTLEERAVILPAGEYSEIACEAFSRVPEEFDLYSYGETNKVKKDFRVISIQREDAGEVRLQALEYNENVYDDTDIIIPQNNYSALSAKIPLVENLKLTERLVKKPDGTIENTIDVWFERPRAGDYYVKTYARAKIYLSDNGGTIWRTAGETTGEHFQIMGDIIERYAYKVRVVSVSELGQESAFDDAPEGEIYVIGKSAPPSDVSTFLVNQDRDRLYFGWTEIADVDVWGYEIRWGADWNSGQVVTFQQGTHYLTTHFRPGIEQRYWIKAIDTSGNYSENAKEAIITIPNIPFRNIIAEFAENPLWSGNKGHLLVDGAILIIESGFLSGAYTCPVRDFGYVSTVYVSIDAITTLYTGRQFNADNVTRFDTSQTLRFSGIESTGVATFEIRTSEDGAVWTEWMPYQAGDYLCRYFQVRMMLTRQNTGDDIKCASLNYFGDLPDVDEYGKGTVSNPAEGCQVFFSKTFHEEPVVNISNISGGGIYSQFTDKSISGLTVKLYDAAGAARSGNFEWQAHGI
jgi:hypothetical protein